MFPRVLVVFTGLLLSIRVASGVDETFAAIRVGSEVYSNVTIMRVTPTHVSFSHNRGMTSAKLEDLDPTMQQHFHYEAQKASALEAEQAQGNMVYHQAARETRAGPVMKSAETTPFTNEFPLLAKSFLNERAPEIKVQYWLTQEPDTKGKFVLLDIWATWCPPCRRAIPHLNEVQAKYQDRLVVIGLSQQTARDIERMTDPQIDYAIGIDPQGRTEKALEVRGIPHLVLIDPKGIVRYQGLPEGLPDRDLEDLLSKFSTPSDENETKAQKVPENEGGISGAAEKEGRSPTL